MRPKQTSTSAERVTRSRSGSRRVASPSPRRKRPASANDGFNTRKRKCPEDYQNEHLTRTVDDHKPEQNNTQPGTSSGRIFDLVKVDDHCWVCHKPANEHYCCNCPRVYHTNCLKRTKSSTLSDCECTWTNIDGTNHKPQIPSNIQLHLLHLIKRIIREKLKVQVGGVIKTGCVFNECFRKWKKDKTKNLPVVMDIDILIDKIKYISYANTGQFFQDFKWIYHNCIKIYGEQSIETKVAYNFEKSMKLHLSDMEACGECFLAKITGDVPRDDYFTDVCSKRHPIVWAKLKGFPFWPAKCLRILNQNADVRFFGTHDKSLIPLNLVYKISRDNPGGSPKASKKSKLLASYEQAMAELRNYIFNFQSQYNQFQFYKAKTPLVLTKSKKKGHQDKAEQDDVESTFNMENVMEIDIVRPIEIETDIADIKDSKANVLQSAINFQNRSNDDINFHSIFEAEVNEEDEPFDGPCTSTSQFQETHWKYTSSKKSTKKIKQCFVMLERELPKITSTKSLRDVPEAIISEVPEAIISEVPEAIISEVPETIISEVPEAIISEVPNDCPSTSRENVTQGIPAPPPSNNMGDDDDIQLVLETTKNSDIFKFPTPIMKTFAEIVLSNKPQYKARFQALQNLTLQMYLGMWMDANNVENNKEFKLLHGFCNVLLNNLEERKADLKKKDKIIKQLKQELNKVKQEKASPEKAFSEKTSSEKSLTERINEAKMDVNAIYAERDELLRLLEHSNQVYIDYKKKNESLTKVIEDLKKKYDNKECLSCETLKTELETSKKNLCDFKRELENEVFQCNLQMDTYTKQIKDLEQQLKVTKSEITMMTHQQRIVGKEKEFFEEQLKHKDDRIKLMESQLLIKDNKIKDLEDQLLEKDNKIKDLEEQLLEKDNKIKDLEEQLLEKDTKMETSDKLHQTEKDVLAKEFETQKDVLAKQLKTQKKSFECLNDLVQNFMKKEEFYKKACESAGLNVSYPEGEIGRDEVAIPKIVNKDGENTSHSDESVIESVTESESSSKTIETIVENEIEITGIAMMPLPVTTVMNSLPANYLVPVNNSPMNAVIQPVNVPSEVFSPIEQYNEPQLIDPNLLVPAQIFSQNLMAQPQTAAVQIQQLSTQLQQAGAPPHKINITQRKQINTTESKEHITSTKNKEGITSTESKEHITSSESKERITSTESKEPITTTQQQQMDDDNTEEDNTEEDNTDEENANKNTDDEHSDEDNSEQYVEVGEENSDEDNTEKPIEEEESISESGDESVSLESEMEELTETLGYTATCSKKSARKTNKKSIAEKKCGGYVKRQR